jgi:hypothetical protein
MALDTATDFHDVEIMILRNAPWEPGQPVTYRLTTPILQTWINCESGLDKRLDGVNREVSQTIEVWRL